MVAVAGSTGSPSSSEADGLAHTSRPIAARAAQTSTSLMQERMFVL
jgi:hypothetical protein